MKELFVILCLLLANTLVSQDFECDTIKLLSGSQIVGQIQKESKINYTYFLCCTECTVPRKVKKKSIDTIILTEKSQNRLVQQNQLLLKKKEENQHQKELTKELYHPLSFNLEVGGRGILGSANIEYQFLRRMGFSMGVGWGIDSPALNSSFIFKFGSKHQLTPSLGSVIHSFPNPELHYTVLFGYQNNFGRSKNFVPKKSMGYIRISPGFIITPDDLWFPILPWIGVTYGFNLSNKTN